MRAIRSCSEVVCGGSQGECVLAGSTMDGEGGGFFILVRMRRVCRQVALFEGVSHTVTVKRRLCPSHGRPRSSFCFVLFS